MYTKSTAYLRVIYIEAVIYTEVTIYTEMAIYTEGHSLRGIREYF